MAGKPESRFMKRHRSLLQLIVIALGVATLVLPVLLAALGTIELDTTRATALLAYSFLFHNIMTGSIGVPLFYRLFKPLPVRRYHLLSGLAGFGLAAAHGILVLVTLTVSAYSDVWVVGPVALALLALTAGVALGRKRIPAVWRGIHQVNYALFVAIYVKAVLIGSNVRFVLSVKVVLTVYLVVAALGLALRLRRHFAGAAARSAVGA